MSSGYINIPAISSPSWKDPVDTAADLPTVNNALGDARVAQDTQVIYVWSGSAWTASVGGSGVTGIGAIDGQTASANGLAISGSNLYAQSASATKPGLVNNTTQSLSGNKTFTGTIAASNLSGTNTGNVTIGTPNGLSLSGQILSLAAATSSVPGALVSADWTTFNNKQAAGSYITALTGDVTASGPGSAASTIANLAITNAKIADTTIDLTAKVTGVLPVANGGTNASSFTAGSVPFSIGTSLSQDNAKFFWDTTNTTLLIGQTQAIPNWSLWVTRPVIAANISYPGAGGFQSVSRATINGSYGTNALYGLAEPSADAGITDSAYSAGIEGDVSRNGLANDQGTVDTIVGVYAFPSQSGVFHTAVTNNAAGFATSGYYSSATVNNIYDFWAQPSGLTGVTYTNRFGIRIDPDDIGSKINYLTGNTVLGGAYAAPATNAVLTVIDGHLKSTQTTGPAIAANTGAGTGASASLSNATDSAGIINLTTTAVAPGTGAQCTITFNKAYNVAPIISLTPANNNAAQLAVSSGVYVSSTTTTAVINFAVTDAIGHAYVWNYQAIETQ